MPFTILHIDSSPLGDRSLSRKLTSEIVQKLVAKNPGAKILRRDFGATPLPHLDAATLAAFFTPADKRDAASQAAVKLSDEAIEELLAADAIVLGVPMWNFGLPSSLKAWIDHVVRAGRTFKYTSEGVQSLLPEGKKVFLALASGGIYSEGPAQTMDFQEPYLKTILGFIGLKDLTFVRAEGVAVGTVGPEKALESAEKQVAAL